MQLIPAKNICSGFELRHLRYFVAVAEELRFGHAARLLDISQPPLSRQFCDLERNLGALLLNRFSRVLTLTESGRVFLADGKRILAEVARAVEVVRSTANAEAELRFKPSFSPYAPRLLNRVVNQ